MQPLIVTPEPLPETGVLANHSSNFSLLKRTQSTQTNRPGYAHRFQDVEDLVMFYMFLIDKGLMKKWPFKFQTYLW